MLTARQALLARTALKMSMRKLRGDRSGLFGVLIAAIVILIAIVVLAAVFLIPFRSIAVDETRRAELASGIEAVEMSLDLDVGQVRVEFVDDPDTAVALNVTGAHRTTLFGSQEPVNVTWEETTEDDTLTVTSTIRVGGSAGPFFANDIDCVLLISRQLRTDLTVSAQVGGVDITASDGVELSALDVRATTGGVRLTMGDNVTLSGPLRLGTTTGGVDLVWNDVRAEENATVELTATTGGVRATVTQTEELGIDLPFRASATVGGVELTLNLEGDTSARVVSSTNVGGISVQDRTGFNGTDGDLRSENYPADSNIEAELNTSTGGVNLRLRYQS